MERRYYFWLMKNLDGQPFLIYGGETEEEAQQKGLEMLGAEFEIKKLPTRNQQTASSLLKGKRLEETRDLRTATRRIKHKIRRNERYGNGSG